MNIRYVGNCRPSYLPQVAGIANQRIVDLSPVDKSAASDWSRIYRQQAVDHILRESGLTDPRYAQVAGDRPILAVFLAYLKETGREPELDELLGEHDFGAWVARRIQMSFGQPDVARELAILCALFPLREEAVELLTPEPYGALLDKLAADGWVERGDNSAVEHWRAIHDVLIDQVIGTYIAGIPQTTEAFVEDGLKIGAAVRSLPSAIIAFQRIADFPLFMQSAGTAFSLVSSSKKRLIPRSARSCFDRRFLRLGI